MRDSEKGREKERERESERERERARDREREPRIVAKRHATPVTPINSVILLALCE